MKGFFKFLIVAGIILVIAGGIMFGIGIGTKAFETGDMKTNTHEITEVFDNINIEIEAADIEIKAATDGNVKVECVEKEKYYHEVSVLNNTLSIKCINNLRWYQKIFNFDNRKIKVVIFLVNTEYDSLNIKTSTGDVIINKEFSFNTSNISVSTGDVNFNAAVKDTVKFEASTGKIRLSNINSNSLDITTSTGDILITNAIINGKITLNTSTGDILIKDSDANTLSIKTSTGDVKGNLLTGKIFKASTSTGRISTPSDDNTKGECIIETSTGDIIIEVK